MATTSESGEYKFGKLPVERFLIGLIIAVVLFALTIVMAASLILYQGYHRSVEAHEAREIIYPVFLSLDTAIKATIKGREGPKISERASDYVGSRGKYTNDIKVLWSPTQQSYALIYVGPEPRFRGMCSYSWQRGVSHVDNEAKVLERLSATENYNPFRAPK